MDPKGYYRALGVAHDSDEEAIKAAFRRRAMELHPDRNQSAEATEQFQRLNEAYGVLGDPLRRQEYDALSARPSTTQSTQRSAAPAAAANEERLVPVPCTRCGCISAQPRLTIFYEVKSFLVITRRTQAHGVYCRACATKQCIRSTTLTWLLGWWGLPWGPIFSIHALFKNLFGGTQPLIPNAWLNAKQAWALAQTHQIDLAHQVALEALRLAEKITPERKLARLRKQYGPGYSDDGVQIRKHMLGLIQAMGRSADRELRLRNIWGPLSGPFVGQGLPLVAAGVLIAAAVSSIPTSTFTHSPPRGPKPYDATGQTVFSPEPSPSVAAIPTAKPVAPIPPQPAYIRPRTAPNGKPWPTKAAYLPVYKVGNNNGHSKLTIDNGQNNAPVFVKLVSLDGPQAKPVRFFYIPGHQRFTATEISAGSYDIRYRDLDSGGLARSEQFTLDERRTYQGIEYSSMEMTLYKVRNGNMQTFDLAEDEF